MESQNLNYKQTENFISQLILPDHIIFHILNQNSEFWHKISSISITVEAYNRTTACWSNEHTITMNKEECPKRVERSVDALAKGTWRFSKFLSLMKM